jgi:polysaccharide pyruvyl transferase WcaK-like protein
VTWFEADRDLVVPFGFYGAGNIGDEATLQGFARLLSQCGADVRVAVASQNPDHTSWVEPAFTYFNAAGVDPRRYWAKLRADAHVFAGGTPIMDVLGEWPLNEVAAIVRAAVGKWRAPVSFVGVGIEGLRSEESRRIVADAIVPHVRHWSVRSAHDRLRLLEYGASADAITVAADMAWLIAPATREFGRARLGRWGIDPRRPLVGVNVVNENGTFDREPHIVPALASALDALATNSGAQVIFLANEVREDSSFDKAAALRVMSGMRRSERAMLAPNEYLSPQQMMSLIGCCNLTISMRYHFCLFSALQSVPFIAIERSDKVSDLCLDLNWAASMKPPQLTSEVVLGHATMMEEDVSLSWAGELRSRVQDMKSRALRNVAGLVTLPGLRPLAATSRYDDTIR